MSIEIVRELSPHQITQLKAFFALFTVAKISRIDSSGDLIVEYSERYSMALHTKLIPFKAASTEFEDAEFEIFQPKQLNK